MKPAYLLIIVIALALFGLVVYLNAPSAPLPSPTSDVQEEQPQGKLNIDAVCTGALAYMSFTDGESADAFVAECKEGKHPEVIERYKADMSLGDGAAI